MTSTGYSTGIPVDQQTPPTVNATPETKSKVGSDATQRPTIDVTPVFVASLLVAAIVAGTLLPASDELATWIRGVPIQSIPYWLVQVLVFFLVATVYPALGWVVASLYSIGQSKDVKTQRRFVTRGAVWPILVVGLVVVIPRFVAKKLYGGSAG